MDKPAPGKYGRKNRASRTRNRSFYGNKRPEKSNTVDEQQQGSVEEVVVDVVDGDWEDVPQEEENIETPTSMSASAKKLKTINVPTQVEAPECNIIMNSTLLVKFIEKLSKCPECGDNINIVHEVAKKKGLAHFFSATCMSEICDWTDVLASSKTVDSKLRGKKGYEINLRTCLAFREIGRGYKSICAFFKLMNSPPPMDSRSYRKLFTKLYRAYRESASHSINAAAGEVKGTPDEDGVKNVRASFDGTWQRRGYSSLNGVVACISDGKVVDYEVLCKICRQCQYWNRKKGSPEYEEWKLHHHCSINHTGSAGSMEAGGVMNIYKRSVATKFLRYTKYLGDGDSKAFQDVVAANVYPNNSIEKDECIGHVQKRVGARLRTLKVNYKGKLLSDDKSLCGAGRLTNKAMNTLQNYYGMIIRSNIGNLYQMKKGVAAIVHHCSEYLNAERKPDNDARHMYCPRGENSWCKYQKYLVTGQPTYETKINLPEAVFDLIKPIFSHKDLGSDVLLSKCLHGLTQNPNEAFNQCIWKKTPKETFVARKTLEVAVASAVLNFNDGGNGILNVIDKCGFSRGHYTLLGCAKSNRARVKNIDNKTTVKCKQQRKKLRAQRKGWQDSNDAGEKSYSAGAF